MSIFGPKIGDKKHTKDDRYDDTFKTDCIYAWCRACAGYGKAWSWGLMDKKLRVRGKCLSCNGRKKIWVTEKHFIRFSNEKINNFKFDLLSSNPPYASYHPSKSTKTIISSCDHDWQSIPGQPEGRTRTVRSVCRKCNKKIEH